MPQLARRNHAKSKQALAFCRTWRNQREVKGIHYIQEDSPAEIGSALREFVRQLADPQTKPLIRADAR